MGIKPSIESIEKFIKVLKSIYNIKENCSVIVKKDKSSLNEGIYINYSKEIIFYGEPSLITVLHEVRHFVQFNTDLKKIELSYDDRELDARAWSSSLFYSLYPKEYLNLCAAYKIKFI